jgi:hypothetical protein
LVLSLVAVAVASVAFVLTSHPGRVSDTDEPAPVVHSVTASPTPSAPPSPVKRARPAVKRAAYQVVVFNNSNIKGLAARTADRAHTAGWKVVGEDNWYGTISSSTVYFPPPMRRAARLLAHDLGISRVQPAVAPMSDQKLTVILTADYSG